MSKARKKALAEVAAQARESLIHLRPFLPVLPAAIMPRHRTTAVLLEDLIMITIMRTAAMKE